MRVRSLGHAGIEIRSNGARILCDPWLSPEGAFQASWFPYPDNSFLIDDDLLSPTAIVLSHEHMDHVDPWFLARVPETVPVYVPRYAAAALPRKVLGARRRPLIELEQWQFDEVVPGVRIMFVSEESPMNHDSAIVVTAAGRSLLNMNDARLSVAQIRRIEHQVGGRVDVLALQGAGASWYPICYDYPPERMADLAFRKRLAKLRYVARVLRLARPAACLPFAGPPCFLDPELRAHNDQLRAGGIFPDQRQVVDHLLADGQQAELFFPGDVWDADAGKRHPGPADGFLDDPDYLDRYAERRAGAIEAVKNRHPHPSADLWPAFAGHFESMTAMSPYFNEKIDMRVGFDVLGPGGGTWAVDFRAGRRGVFPEAGDCRYRYRFESRWLPSILDGTVPWEDFFLSLRFRAGRHPDAYNDHLLGLLKFARQEPLDAVEEYETAPDRQETLDVRAGDATYRIQRFCPHAGQDLRHASEVLPGGVLRCLGHHYEFDLATGRCVNGTATPLRTERLDRP